MDKAKFLQNKPLAGPYPIDDLGDVYVREIPFSQTMFVHGDGSKSEDRILRIIIASICESDGKPVFDETDINALRSMGLVRLEPLVTVAMKHSGAQPEDIETAVGNSETTTPNDSGIA